MKIVNMFKILYASLAYIACSKNFVTRQLDGLNFLFDYQFFIFSAFK